MKRARPADLKRNQYESDNYGKSSSSQDQSSMSEEQILEQMDEERQQQQGNQVNQQDPNKSSTQNKGRQDNSLSVLTSKFIQLIKQSPNKTIDLNKAVNKLKVQKRRIYDITNVLEGVGFVQKTHKNTIKWKGDDIEDEKEHVKNVVETMDTIITLLEEQRTMDKEIQEYYQKIREQYLQSGDIKQEDFISLGDCLTIAKNLQKSHPDQKLIVITTPNGSMFQAEQNQDNSISLHINAEETQSKDTIKMYIVDPAKNKIHEFKSLNQKQKKKTKEEFPLERQNNTQNTMIKKQQQVKQQPVGQ